MESRIFGVTQRYQHTEYRWVYQEGQILSDLNIKNGRLASNATIFCQFPLKESESDTTFEVLDDNANVYEFLFRPAKGSESDDPTVEEIGKYQLVVSTDHKSITKQYLNMFHILESDKNLKQKDRRVSEIKRKAEMLGSLGFEDFHDIFSGKRSKLTYKQFNMLFEAAVNAKKTGVFIKGMEKPKNCKNCPFNNSDLICNRTGGQIDRDDMSCLIPCPIIDVILPKGVDIDTLFCSAIQI